MPLSRIDGISRPVGVVMSTRSGGGGCVLGHSVGQGQQPGPHLLGLVVGQVGQAPVLPRRRGHPHPDLRQPEHPGDQRADGVDGLDLVGRESGEKCAATAPLSMRRTPSSIRHRVTSQETKPRSTTRR